MLSCKRTSIQDIVSCAVGRMFFDETGNQGLTRRWSVIISLTSSAPAPVARPGDRGNHPRRARHPFPAVSRRQESGVRFARVDAEVTENLIAMPSPCSPVRPPTASGWSVFWSEAINCLPGAELATGKSAGHEFRLFEPVGKSVESGVLLTPVVAIPCEMFVGSSHKRGRSIDDCYI
jgi:hypothetical protein